MIRSLVVALTLSLISCSGGSVPSGMLEPSKMYPLVKDIMLTDEYINNFLLKEDTTLNIKKKRSEMYERVFALHNTNKDQFYKSFTYYQEHPDLQKVLFDSLSEAIKPKVVPKPVREQDTTLKEIN
jgi:hypothetical protein